MKKQDDHYTLLCASDVIAPIKHRLKAGAFEIEEDNTIQLQGPIDTDRTWINAAHDHNRKCNKWLEVYFKYYRLIPRGCRNCWKICYKPENLKELFAIHRLQEEMAKPSKCGLELRGFTGNKGGYGSFWYAELNAGLRGARSLYDLIDVKIQTLLATDEKKNVILKRGCTEMENFTISQGFASDKWDDMAEKSNSDQQEALLDTIFLDERKVEMPSSLKRHIERKWIEYAFEHGDMTYLEYVGGEPLMPQLVHYHNSKHKHQDFKTTWRKDGPNITRLDDARDKSDGAEGSVISRLPE